MQEKLYRFLYENVRKQEVDEINFDMNVIELRNEKIGLQNCLISKTELLFYLPFTLVLFHCNQKQCKPSFCI